MLVKIVDTVVATDSVGRPVDAIPIREWEEGETSITGVPLAAVEIEESDVGVPVRFVVGKTAQNSAGQWVDSIPTTGGGGVTLPYDPVLILLGDSQAQGNDTLAARNAFAASYVPDPNVLVLNASNAFAQYVPGTFTGMETWADNGQPGPEVGFIRRFRAAFPNNNLRIIKMSRGGSFQDKPNALGTFTGSISGQFLTVTAGTAPPNQSLITGSGIPTGTYVIFARSGVPGDYVLGTIGSLTPPNITFASGTITRYNALLSWSTLESTLYRGYNSITNGYRARAAAGLALSANYRVIAAMHVLGTNDAANAAPGVFRTKAEELIADYRTQWSLPSDVLSIFPRYSGGPNVRADLVAMAAADPRVKWTDTDSYGKQVDGVHWNMASLDLIGSDAFDLWAATL